MHRIRVPRHAYFGEFILALAGMGPIGCGESSTGEVKVGGALIDPEVEAANARASEGNADIIKAKPGKPREVGAP